MEALLAADASTWSKPRIRACEMAIVTVLTRDDHGLDEDASNKTGEEWRVLMKTGHTAVSSTAVGVGGDAGGSQL